MSRMFGPPPDVTWSTETGEADWIRDRLAPFDEGLIGSEVPLGFVAYARVLHPLRPYPAQGLVRWGDVAAWAGRKLRPDSEYHSIAFPLEDRDEPPPWNAARPRRGTLDSADTGVLIEVLREHTSTPDRCWFCLWDGYGWGQGAVAVLRQAGEPASPPPAPVDPIPTQVRNGPRVEMPERDYFLYVGPIDDALACSGYRDQTPNLFWPDDHAWCVASPIGRTSSYVGGEKALVDRLVSSRDIEALSVDPSRPASRFEEWVEVLATSAAETLVTSGEVTITTTQGTIKAWIEQNGPLGRKRTLARAWIATNGRGRGESRVGIGKDTGMGQRDLLGHYLAMDIVQLVE